MAVSGDGLAPLRKGPRPNRAYLSSHDRTVDIARKFLAKAELREWIACAGRYDLDLELLIFNLDEAIDSHLYGFATQNRSRRKRDG